MKTRGEIEAAVCDGITRFEQDYMGRGPKHIHAYLIGDLLKEVRTQLLETARTALEGMVEKVTGSKVVSLHHDISTMSGEEVVLFALAESPLLRQPKKK